MSQEEVLTGKAKKAKRSEERVKKKDKKKKEPKTEDAEITLENGVDEQVNDESVADAAKTKSKKRRRGEESTTQTEGTQEAAGEPSNDTPTNPAKRKKQKQATNPEAGAVTAEPDVAGDAANPDEAETAKETPAKQRFIVFIGNLPFATTTEMLEKHFASITPASVRHLTDPRTKKSKGYAFLEFNNYDRMKTCLKLYHHSVFDTGIGGEKGKRRINVELTAGGGGKSEGRKEKLKVKNERLEDQRKRRAEVLAKQEKRKGTKGGKDGGVEKTKTGSAPRSADDSAVGDVDTTGIHPSRLAQMGAR